MHLIEIVVYKIHHITEIGDQLYYGV